VAGGVVSESAAAGPSARYCPFCGQPLGSFFGNRMADGSLWCEGCQESFRVSSVNLHEGTDSPTDGEGAT
jgi:hypothetical protein